MIFMLVLINVYEAILLVVFQSMCKSMSVKSFDLFIFLFLIYPWFPLLI